jgi:2,5-diketo-D-gluconate reductase A
MTTDSQLVIPAKRLNSGAEIPLLGLGTWPMKGDEAADAIATAITMGYRCIDTAAKYDNEADVGRGIAMAGVPRGELFVTTKLRGSDQGYDQARAALHASLDRLALDYVDLYLIHWPLPRLDQDVESYQAMIEMAGEGLIRSVGVSNFKPAHIDRIVAATGVVPAVDQIQLSPIVSRKTIRPYLDEQGVCTQAWSPLGRGNVAAEPSVAELAAKYGRTPAQVVLRWHVQQGIVAIPKSSDPGRQHSNADIFDFELDPAEMEQLSALDRGEAAAVDSDVHEEF